MPNGIIKYTSKDYDSIKSDLIDSISSLTDLWTSREESDPGIVLLKNMSALGDMLSFNFDKQALEYYGPTVTQRKNAYKLFELVGYHMKWYTSAMTTVTLTYNPPMPEYIQYFKKVMDDIDENDIVNDYFDYRNRYRLSASDPSPALQDSIAIPPVVSSPYVGPETDIPVPGTAGQINRRFIEVDDEGGVVEGVTVDPISFPLDERIKQIDKFKENAMLYKETATQMFKIWLDNPSIKSFELHTNISDPYKTLELLPNNSGSLMYSIIPVIDNTKIDSDGNYKATVILHPYKPTKIKAIQGFLKTISFNSNQLRNNKFYIPESDVDEEHMYVSYMTYDSNAQRQIPVFLKKTDNLLTITNIHNQSGSKDEVNYSSDTIYFQFKVDDFDYPYIELSSYWKDILSDANITFTFYYFKTVGKYGNITSNYLKRLSNYSNSDITVTNVDTNISVYDSAGEQLSYPGRNLETAQDAYINSLNYIMTYNTLVTIYDFERYTNRQSGFSNSLAVDNQRAFDINTKLALECQSYTEQQLRDILGEYDSSYTKDDLIRCLFNSRKVVYNYKNAPVTKEDAKSLPIEPKETTDGKATFKSYSIHMYPVYGNFETNMLDNENVVNVANIFNTVSGNSLPYQLYKINTSTEGFPQDECRLEEALDEAYKDCHIVNVEPSYTALRVFPWRCCGVLHLTKCVDTTEAQNIISNVISTIARTYTASSQQFGKKVVYMDLIQTVLSADNRIRYFDAGLGNKKLIEFENKSETPQQYFNADAYFNTESIMRYVQTVYENENDTASPYYKWLSIDPAYIQGSNED